MIKVLIIKLSSIGDVVHTLPALKALRDGLGPAARIDWLVEEAASGVLSGHPLIDEVIVVKRGWARGLSENLKTAGLLRSRGYDLVLDFQGLLKSGVWVLLAGGKRKIGFSNARELSHIFLNEKLPSYDPEMHAVDRYLALARHAGGAAGAAGFTLELGGAIASVKEKLRQKGVDDSFFVMVTRARWAAKLWKDELFIESARRITADGRLKAVLTGGAADRPALEEMAKAAGGAYIATDLKEMAALSALSSFVLTVDSGPMHLAVAAGAKVIALFGPTAPWRTGPYGAGHIIIRQGLPCSPCYKRECVDPICMSGITVDEVMEAVEKLR
ncbi:MAG TPA: lipopolysaccharide heptosyltransferase I [Deltaproteobacteria bacterium]|nr:lipopolysaccharide heptosyltransferase I [Deltaproteobacteria bacterium]HCY10989.1 lipopolysaccharide heptosyltransferase I [Deltaproteobacteria bacterium]